MMGAHPEIQAARRRTPRFLNSSFVWLRKTACGVTSAMSWRTRRSRTFRRDGFLHSGGVDQLRSDALCYPILYGLINTTRRDRRYRQLSEWIVDESDCTQSDGCDGWALCRQA